MLLANVSPSVDDMKAIDLGGLSDGADAPDCEPMMRVLSSKVAAASEPLDGECLLLYVLSVRLDADDTVNPLRPGGWFEDAPAEEHWRVLAEWLPSIAEAEVAARVADLLWTNRFGDQPHEMGRAAIKYYVQSGERIAHSSQWHFRARDRYLRAMQLARIFRCSDDVTRSIEACLGDGVHKHLSGTLMTILLDSGVGDPSRWRGQAEEWAEQAEADGQADEWGSPWFATARLLWEVSAKWSSRFHGDREHPDAIRLRTRAARTSVLEADKARDAGRPFAEAHCVERAISELRTAGASKEARSLLSRLHDVQDTAPSKVHRSMIDVSEMVKLAEQGVRGTDVREAVLNLAFFTRVPQKAQLRSTAVEYLQSSVAARLAWRQIMSHDGRVTAYVPPLAGPELDEERDAEIIAYQMRWHAAGYHRVIARVLVHALDALRSEHHVPIALLCGLAHQSALVPPDHEMAFAKGLHAGFHGDFVVACHLLVPQLENALRNYLEKIADVSLLNLRSDGSQHAGLLDRILSSSKLEERIGADLVFDLRGLLIAQDSTNLRNNLSHGLIPDAGFGTTAVYCWWLCLRIVFLFIEDSESAYVETV